MTECIELIKKLPRRIFVDQYEFQLKLVATGAPELHASAEDNGSNPGVADEGDGLTDFNAMRIYLSNTLPLHRFVEVVCHEITHAINWSRGIEDGSSEEDFTDKYSAGFVRFLLDNPKYHTWLNRVVREIRKQRTSVGDLSDQ
jgi:hypothetical protein